MLKNLWDKVEFYCCNHNEPQLMYEYPSNTPFYTCRRYMRKDALHPDGHEDNEPSCTNRLSYYAAASILEKLNELIEAEMDDDCFGDYTVGVALHVIPTWACVMAWNLCRAVQGPQSPTL